MVICQLQKAIAWITAIEVVFAQDAILEQITGEVIPTPDLDRIEFFSQHPILLDTASLDELIELPYMTHSLARRIIHTIRHKKPRTVTELCTELQCTEEQHYILERCTRIGSANILPFQLTIRSRAMVWATPPHAATDGRFRGTPHELYNRATATTGATSIAALSNKDPGEPLAADFVSASLRQRFSTGSDLIVGDYYFEHGLGLIAWRPFGSRKGTDVITPVTECGRGFQQYRSALEYRFFRGVAISHVVRVADSISLLARGGISRLPRTGSIDSIANVITSLATDGYHRTVSEITRRHSVNEHAYIGTVEVHTQSLHIGAGVISLQYPIPITSTSTLVMPAQRGIFGSIYVYYTTDSLTLVAELARDYSGRFACRAGIEYPLHSTLLALGARWYAPEFRSPFGYNFGESAQPINEAGIYLGVRVRWSRTILHLLYADFYQSHVPTATLPRLRRGVDLFNELRMRLGGTTLLFIRVRQEHRTESILSNWGSSAQEFLRTTLRCELQQTIKNWVLARVRCEGVYRGPTGTLGTSELGIASFADLAVKMSERLTIGGRITLFHTASFASAIYTFEQLAPGLLISIPLYASGSRLFGYVRWEPLEQLSIWARYGVHSRINVPSIGSGVTEILGTDDARIHVQVDVRL